MTLIKICGVTNVDDAEAAADLGADLVGFIMVPESPRYVQPSEAFRLARMVPSTVTTVGVYRDLADVCNGWRLRFGMIQYYGNAAGLNLRVPERMIFAARIQDEESLAGLAADSGLADTILLDAYHPDKLGGSGETFDWNLAVSARERTGKPIILAGGLTPENVADAVERVRPYGVDVSSGVEATPGRKDLAKVKAFIDAVREADSAIQ